MRILTKREVAEKISYHPESIGRLEASAGFPRRLRLGPGKHGRVGWIESEVDDWILWRAALRDQTADSAGENPKVGNAQ